MEIGKKKKSSFWLNKENKKRNYYKILFTFLKDFVITNNKRRLEEIKFGVTTVGLCAYLFICGKVF